MKYHLQAMITQAINREYIVEAESLTKAQEIVLNDPSDLRVENHGDNPIDERHCGFSLSHRIGANGPECCE